MDEIAYFDSVLTEVGEHLCYRLYLLAVALALFGTAALLEQVLAPKRGTAKRRRECNMQQNRHKQEIEESKEPKKQQEVGEGQGDDCRDDLSVLSKDSIFDDGSQRSFRICFTGGPCGGKSTAISTVSTLFRKQGITVVTVPEVASMIYSSGASLDLSTYTDIGAINFQASLLNLQAGLETVLESIGRLVSDSEYNEFSQKDKEPRKMLVLCDRGLLDGSAYLNSEQWEQVLRSNSLIKVSTADIYARYDMILHMVTAADGAEDYYQTLNNEARSEDVALALSLDDKIYKMYCYHYSYYRITNQGRSMEDKVNVTVQWLYRNFFGIRNPVEQHRVFLLKNPKGKVFRFLKKSMLGPLVRIEETYLKKDEGGVVYVRKIDINGNLSFLKGKRTYKKGQSSVTKKTVIQWREFQDLIEVYGPSLNTLVRERIHTPADPKSILEDLHSGGVSNIYVEEIGQGQERLLLLYFPIFPGETSPKIPAFFSKLLLKEITDDELFRLENISSGDWRGDLEVLSGLEDNSVEL